MLRRMRGAGLARLAVAGLLGLAAGCATARTDDAGPAAGRARAGPTAADRAGLAAARAGLEHEREAIVASALRLDGRERRTFWPLYRRYRGEMAGLDGRRLSILDGRAARGGSPANDEARAALDELLELRIARAEVQRQYALQLYERLPAWKVARFFEIETRMDAVVDYHLSRAIPLLD